MGFQQGLSGLAVSAKALDAIGNNVANANTVGYKAASAQFADVFAASLAGGGAGQVGIGSSVGGISQLFTQGNVTATSNPLDMAINGSGFYRMASASGAVTYTRSGQFELDKNGFVVNGSALKLTGYAADPITGQISPGDVVPLQVTNSNIAPKVTTASSIKLNLDSRSRPPTAMTSGSLTGAVNLASTGVTITAGSNDVLDLVVDGQRVSVTIPGRATAYTPSELATTVETLLNAKLTGGVSVDVTGSAGSPLTIISNSKGSVGSQGAGSGVVLDAASDTGTPGGTAASALLAAPVATAGTAAPAAGFLTAGVNLPASVTIASGQSFSLTVDGTTKTVSLPAGTYSTALPAPTGLGAALAAAMTTAGFAAPAPTATVTATSGAPLVITSASTGVASTVQVASLTSGLESLFGPATVAGKDNFNTVTAQTSGSVTGGMALNIAAVAGPPALPATYPVITAATNDTLDLTVDGQSVTVTLAPKAAPGYNGAAGNELTVLAADLQTKANAALALLTPATTARVTVSVNSSNKLVVTSNSEGTGSTVAVSGNATATLFGPPPTGVAGSSPTVVAGTQTQTINPLGFTASTPQTVYDSQGGAHNLTLYFVKTSNPNAWQMYTTLDGGQQRGPTTMTFNGAGVLQTPMPLTLPAEGDEYTFTPSSTNASRPDALSFTLDLTGTTQYGITYGVNTQDQDGYSSGQLSGISVAADGTIQGRFSNGQSKAMGQIVLVSFNNPNGLQSLGGNQWADTAESGQPIRGTPGTGSLGVIQSAAIEESNVDLTAELVAMITQQRVYQANAQTIKTQDQVLSTLVNLR